MASSTNVFPIKSRSRVVSSSSIETSEVIVSTVISTETSELSMSSETSELSMSLEISELSLFSVRSIDKETSSV